MEKNSSKHAPDLLGFLLQHAPYLLSEDDEYVQVSHVASAEGWAIPDCSNEISFSFEMWHFVLIAGLVVLISSCRYLLLKTWTDFAESSQSANQQVLTSLQPLDYVVVTFLPGISEKLLSRGALVVAVVFGFLHLGSGRKYSFAVWKMKRMCRRKRELYTMYVKNGKHFFPLLTEKAERD